MTSEPTENNAEQRREAPALSQAKAALLAKWVRGGKSVDAGIPRRGGDGPAPASFAQRRLWFLHRLHPDSAAYNMVNAYRLRGRLDAAALEAALSGVVRRHEALRTTLRDDGGEPVQDVHPATPVPLPVWDLSGLDEAERERARHGREETEEPVDLEAGPVLRARLLRLADDDHELLVTVHHAAFDEGSELRFQTELATLYANEVQAAVGRATLPLPEPRIQYADYAAWQQDRAGGEAEEEHLAYWNDQLAGLPPLDLPTDRPRPAEPSMAGDMHAFGLPRDLSDRFRALCREADVTLHMGLLAAWQTLLHRYSGQDDLAVGGPVGGRTRAETDDLVGFFVNTLVLRADFSDAPSFREVLGRTRRTCLDAYAHQEVPFERVVERVKPERDPSRTPLFQALFSLQNAVGAAPSMPGLEMEARFVVSPTSKFDLSLYMLDHEDGFRGWLEYSTDLFDAATARRMAGHLERLLESACAEPDAPVGRLRMVPDEEREALDAACTAPAATPPHPTVDDWFRDTASAGPDRVAVRTDDEAVTYAALDARADAIAHALQRSRVGPGSVVGLCLERSCDMAAAVLAILRLGAAYLPLDPSYPRDRLALMLDDSGAGHVLAGPGLRDVLPPTDATVVALPDADAEADGDAADTPPPAAVAPSDTAYVLYTSGSTGKPKGTPVHHGALTNLLAAARDELDVTPDDVLLGVTTLNFDIGTLELLLPLVTGATLRMVDRETARDPAALLALVPEATLMQATPATWRMLVDAGWPPVPSPARRLRALSGGEPLAPDLAAAVLDRAAMLWNGYGPTEATIYSTFHRVRPEDLAAPRVPIGRPVAGTVATVRDAHGAVVPVGVPGELWLGGVGLSTGYLGRPELTAERFVEADGTRLYRTGDLVRWLPDGTLDYLGRMDRQLKVRGFRIEPGEVESALRGHDDVRHAVVTARRSGEDARLIAYVVPGPGAEDDLPARLRTHLAALLPAHMVPSAFVALDAVPLLPNGKVDLAALPAPDESDLAREAAFEPPRTETERALAALWSELLDVERVGRDDGFFALGGHSLLAARSVADVQDRFGVALPLRVLFATPRLHDIARAVDDLRGRDDGAAPPIVPRPDRDGLPLSWAQERMWFLHRVDPDSPAYNMAFAHRLRGPLNPDRLRAALDAVVARHEALRTVVGDTDDGPVQRVLGADEAHVAWDRHDLRDRTADEADAPERDLLAEAAARPFDLGRGPVLRATLVRRADDEWVLLLVLHHFAFDERSHDVLLRDLGAAYDETGLGPAPLQYGDASAWQREAGVDDDALAAWSERLRDVPALDLPATHPAPATRSFRGGHVEVDLPADARDRLLALAREADATPFMALLAAFQATLHRLSGQTRFAVAAPSAGRPAGTDDVVGFFVNTLALPAEVDPDGDFTDLLGRVRETCADAYAHDLPYAALAARLQALRGDTAGPAQAFLSLERTGAAPDDGLSRLRVASWMVPTRTSKFDLSLFARDDGTRLHAALEYSTDLFDEDWARRAADGFRTLLESALASPRLPVGDLPLERADAARAWLAACNPAPTPLPGPVHEQVREQARRSPDAVAVEAGDAGWTYAELEARAAGLAARLEARGAGPGVLVGVHLERGPDLVAALLAVLRTGAAYVPLDPGHPAARRAAVLADAGVRLVVTAGDADGLPEGLVRVRADRADGDDDGRAEPRADLPTDLAYVLHTSGSTGRPKGVLVGHRALSNLLQSMRDEVEAGPGDRLLAVTTVTFDIAALELFLPLVSGATLRVARREEATDPRRLAELARDATLLQATPATWRMLVDDDWAGNDRLRALCGGEALPVDLARALRPRVARLWNVYGPTETTIWSTLHEVDADAEFAGSVPVGRPLSNTRVYVLDARGNPCPVGVRGELCIAGAGVAAGYLDRPDLSAERFVADPFVDGERMYRTGDLALWRPDGLLECLGRLDRQLKVRGFRIEPGEVEHALRSDARVRDAVVVARELAPGYAQLVAYVAADAETDLDGVRAGLRGRLPEHMVPGLFVQLDALPLNANRKVDVNALPEPAAPSAQDREPEPPRTPTEEALAELWRDLLGVERVGVADDFLRLGGHSLLAARLAARVRSALGVEVPLRDLLAATRLEQQAELVDAAQAARDGTDRPAAEPVLSPQQQRMLFLHGLDPEGAAYNMAVARRVRGPVQLALLERALTEVVHRHAPLRTVFRDDDGQPRPVVQAVERVPVAVLEAADEDEARRVAAEEAHRPFDLTHGPLLRATLVRLAADDHVLLVGVHHVAFDEASEAVLLRDLRAAYAAARDGRPPRFPPLASTYARHAAATRTRLESGELDGQVEHWKRRLTGLPPLDLPTDRPRPAVPSHAGATTPLRVPEATARRLRELCQAEGATLHMGLLAAWQALLHRHSGQDDFAVGSPVSGRDGDAEGLVGFFVNTLALRAELDGAPSFRTLLRRARETCLDAYAHQDVPLERLVEALGVARGLERTPLFQVAFLLQSDEAGAEADGADGLRWEPFALPGRTAKFDLTLAVTDRPGDLPGFLEYSNDLFEPGTAERMAAHFERLLSAVVDAPDEPVAHAPMLGPDEEAQIKAWNDTARPPPGVPTLHRMFEAQARRTPDAVALVQGDERLSYARLDAAATRFAHRLVALGVGPGDLVGISTRRSLDTQVAVLGVLKAGAAYLPLDPGYPRERLAFMVEDAAPRLVVTHAELAQRLPVDADRLLLVDGPDADEEAPAVDLPDATGDDLAYVIYTSGSTGKPKGVLLEHAGAANLALAQADLFSPGPGDRVLQFASLSFDASVWEWLMALTTGAALVVPPADVTLAGDDLRDQLESQRITLATLPPTALATLPEEARLPDLHTLVVAGEACAPPLVRHWSRGRRFVNAYGPTEASVCVTAHVAEDPPRRVLPIGRPLRNMEAHVLDANRRPVPVGVPGELYAGGAGLARGYHERPELTTERFVEVDGRRLYRTGDLVRRLPDGQLDFLGRIDHQVKVRGYRIELGEVESALLELDAVSEALVVAREDAPGDKRLVAYVTGAAAPDAAALRAHLESRLPAHMVPAAFVVLDAFPLTPNGKVDRRALPAPDASAGVASDEAYVAPRTPREAALCEVWREVLRVPRVGIHDNFFALGGDSILSIQVVARAQKRGLRLTTRALFDHQTVAELAALAGEGAEVQAEQGLVSGAVPLTPIQHWFTRRDLPARHHFNQSVLLELADTVPDARVEDALARLASHHDALRLRLRVADEAGGWEQDHVTPDEAWSGAFRRIDLSRLDADEQDAAMLAACQDAQSGLAPHDGRNVRCLLFDLGAERPRRLLWTIHHNAVDGVSWRILLEDLDTLLASDDAAVPPKTTSFRDWATRLVEHARTDEALREQLPYWLAQTDDARLPRDHGGADRVEHERDVTVRLDAEDTEALLRDLPRASGGRTEEALLAALATALRDWTGRDAVLVEVEGHGREDVLSDVDTSRTVGWFTTTHPLRIDLADPDADAVLDAVRSALRAVPDRGIGHGLLAHLGPDEAREALASIPAPEVSFNYLGRFDDAEPDADGPARVRMLDEPHGDDVARTGARHRLLELNGAVMAGRLSMRFSFADTVHDRATIQRVADRFEAALTEMARTWRERARRLPSADADADGGRFPLVRESPARLDRVLSGRESRVADVYPLTPMQEGMLFHSLREPETGVYVEQSVFVLDGEVDLDALESAWRSVVARHDVLRAGFAWEGLDQPLQLVHHDAPLEVARLDWSDADAAEQDGRLERFLHDDRVRGFDLTRPPLMRVALVRLAAGRSRMVWTNHHALLDGWSLPVLLDELGRAYAAHRDGTAPELGPVRPFSSFVAHLQGKADGAAETYWREALSGLDEPTPLPVPDRAASEAHAATAALPGEAAATLDPETLGALQELARRSRVTLNTLLQAAWSVVLARHSDRDDVVFGATVSGRPAGLEGVESMVGLFINTLPVRVHLADDEPLAAWLADLQRRHVEMREHEHVPLVRVRSWSPLPAGAELFESLLVFENYPWTEGSLQALPITDVRGLSRTNFPLTLVAAPGEGLGLRLFWDTERFEGDAVQSVLGRLVGVLHRMARAGPDAAVGDLSLVDDAESERLAAWGAATTEVGPACIHDLVRARAAEAPERVAVEKGDARLSYAELDARSDAFATGLAASGIGPGDVLAVAVRPSPDAVAAVLGILKSGAAYVPIDPDYPAERVAYMLQDSAAATVVTTGDLADRFGDAGARVVLLDDDAAWRAPTPSAGLPATTPGDLAYVLYTSGSTGRPKGVLVEHRGAAALAAAQRETFGVDAGTRVLQFASWSFDASVWEMLMALANGATLCLPPERVAGEALQSYLASATVHVATLPPTVLRSLDPAALPDLRVVVSAGEELAPDLRDAWAAGRRMFNAYGPTESTVCASVAACRPGEGTPTIGTPFAAARIVLLDRRLRPVPVGVAGELCIGGDCLARGYHDRPELTAERFVEVDGRRLYRTGDLARWNQAGELEFLGRIDHQVKVRGHRIECGEVETALRAVHGVDDAFVTARPDPAGGQRLVAYVVGTAVPAAAALREHLARSLPEPMLPSAFVALEALPLSPNGKVDRKALPDPEAAAVGDDFVAPRDPVEQILAGIWQRVLAVPRVGVHDDFFALGGHSLSATQVASRIRDALGVEVPLRTVFAARSLAALADEVRALRADGTGLAVPPVTPHDDPDEPAPLSFAQQRLWFLDQWEPGSAVYNIPAFYRLRGALDVRALESALSETVRRHRVLRAVYDVDDDGTPRQRVLPHERLALEVVDLSHLPPEDREAAAQALADEESRRPFDLARGPVYRVRLVRLARDEHWMLLAFHHVAFDGWSMGVLLREVGDLYEAYTAGREPDLAEPAVQYADFARWQRTHLDESVLAPQMAHWQGALAGVQPLDLPTDRPRPRVQSSRGGHRWFALPERLSERIRALGREEGVTLFMPLLAAFETLLWRWSGQDDFAVGTPVAGRTRAETEELLGFFVNTLVLRADVEGDPSFRDLLGRVRARCLDAYANQDVPFERLVGELHPQRDTSRSPLFQAMFALQEEALDGNRWGPVHVDGIPVSSNASKFDVTLFVADAGDRLEGLVEYRSDLFDGETMARLAAQYHALLEAAVDDPDRPLSELSLLPGGEREAVLDAPNQTERPYPDAHCIHDLFAAQAARRPDAEAVSHAGRSLTYRDLDARAEAIAAGLAAHGVGPGDAVAVLLDRSIDTVAAFWGVLRLGAVYVPVDARNPPERTAFLLEDADVRAVLHHARLADRLGDWDGARVDVDAIDGVDEAAAPVPAPFTARPDAPAYVIYTSGSTGKPKGVVVGHGGACNLAEASRDAMGIHAGSRVLQFASPAFDASVLEMVGALANGACLVVPPPGHGLSGDDLLRLLRQQRVSFTLLPPAALATLPPDADLPDLERLLTGGDALPASLARAWAGRVSLANAYGPTEATVAATLAEVPAELDGAPPIGRPLQNVRAYVLDEHLHPLPVGVPGELCLGGVGLAHGYLNRPGLTEERFVTAPFADGQRLYRTGDRARWRSDGQLEFLGRTDEQVKVRGHRVEPGEVESVLREHEAVADCVVVAREDEPGDKRLVAYVVPRGDAPTVSDLRARLARSLPDVMVPAAVVFLDALPLSPNGKVDRRALPAPAARPALAHAYAAPRTETERVLSDAWKRALKLERVGVRDNFFDVGGDSLLTVRVAALAREAGLRVEPRHLFEHQSVEELARALDDGAEAATGTVVILRRRPDATDRPLFLVHAAGGGVAPFAHLARALERDLHAFQAPGIDAGTEPVDSVAGLARRYVDDMRRVQPEGPYLVGGWSFGALVAHEMARLLEEGGEHVEHLVLLEPSPPPRLFTPPAVDVEAAMADPRAPDLLEALGLPRDAQVGPDEVRRRVRVRAVNVAAMGRHEPGVVHCPTALVQTGDTRQRFPALATAWLDLLAAAPTEHEVPGDHDHVVDAEHVPALAAVLDRILQPEVTA